MAKMLVSQSDEIFQALHAAGVIDVDPTNVRRCVIDLQVGSAARIYLETFADEEKLRVALLGGLEVDRVLAEATP